MTNFLPFGSPGHEFPSLCHRSHLIARSAEMHIWTTRWMADCMLAGLALPPNASAVVRSDSTDAFYVRTTTLSVGFESHKLSAGKDRFLRRESHIFRRSFFFIDVARREENGKRVWYLPVVPYKPIYTERPKFYYLLPIKLQFCHRDWNWKMKKKKKTSAVWGLSGPLSIGNS